MVRYFAFGLNICSEIEIAMLRPCDTTAEPDVTICRKDLSSLRGEGMETFTLEPQRVFVRLTEKIACLMENGNSIAVDAAEGTEQGLLAVYLLGSCMGAILIQRGNLLLHGSCVAKDGKAVLLTGDSGAGKSTLAARFLANGWRLVTDDVAVVRGIEEHEATVYPSYPSQKLWQDAIDRTDYKGEKFSLFQEERREKFNIRVEAFSNEPARLTAVVRLVPTDAECSVEEITGFVRVDQLMRNTYRSYMIPEKERPKHFQRCVTLGNDIHMLAALRARDRDTTQEIYDRIVSMI